MYIGVSGIVVVFVDPIVVCLLCVWCGKNIYRRASVLVFVMIVCIWLYLRGDRVKHFITESLRATESTVDVTRLSKFYNSVQSILGFQ